MSHGTEVEAQDPRDAPAAALERAKVRRTADDADVEAARRLDIARAVQAEQDNAHRGIFVKWVIRTVSASIVVGAGIMAAYAFSQWHSFDSAVLISRFSASVVQTIGLAYVVAHYLFPSRNS
ncbi:MAG: hypothetical protein FWF28_06235 [Micrococcales bacterium]|nr:hypothetical protein [Micrococcales bacterium]